MKLVNYRREGDSAIRCGVVAGDRIIAASTLIPGVAWNTLQDAYEDWERLDEVSAQPLPHHADGVKLDQVTLLPPSHAPGSIFFAGFNYHDHVENMRVVFNLPKDPSPKEIGQDPWHNLKPRNTLCGSGAVVELQTAKTDWEIELAVVIGRPARRVCIADALQHVAGYTVAVDLSARDRAFRPHADVGSVARMDWIAQKGFEGACPLGPWLIPRRLIPDPQALDLQLSVNGDMKQDSNTRHMIFSVAEAISHLSSLLTLSPGDIILTGTPAGTGIERGESLKPGDRLVASIGHIGDLVVHFA